MSDETMSVTFKHSGKEFTIAIEGTETVGTLKRKIQDHTQVLPKRQKILGLKSKSGRPPGDEDEVKELQIKPGQKLMVMGAPEEVIQATDDASASAPELLDDLGEDVKLDWESVIGKKLIAEKIEDRVSKAKAVHLNAPRPGKKCLVLDIDYTFFDLDSTVEHAHEKCRPYLHEMLAAVYPYYDIVIWSATSMKWIQIKMRELHVSDQHEFKLTCLLDYKCMISVSGTDVKGNKHGNVTCKPLQVLWGKYPEHYNAANTIIIDDLVRNFTTSTQNGLTIKPYKKCYRNWATDKELLWLKLYLLKIARKSSFSDLKHHKWKKLIASEIEAESVARFGSST